MTAIELYNKMSNPPKNAVKTIQAGDLKGMSDINPQWRIKIMTECFGLCGIGWKYEIMNLWTNPGAGKEILAFAQIALYVRNPDTQEWSEPIIGTGGSKLVNEFSKGPKSNDEGFKMAITDALGTAMKQIGVAAAIYAGEWDGSKYSEQNGSQPAHPGNKPAAKPAPTGPKGGPDTEAEHNEINRLLCEKAPDGKQIFDAAFIGNLPEMRQKYTAQEVIKQMKEKIANAQPEYMNNMPNRQHPQPEPQYDPQQEIF